MKAGLELCKGMEVHMFCTKRRDCDYSVHNPVETATAVCAVDTAESACDL